MYKELLSVDLSNNALGSRGLAQCAPLIEKQTSLQSLFLADTGLAAESARLLLTFFPAAATALRVLDIHGNRLESQGLVHISAIVEKSPNLKRLRVSSVGASADATTTLAQALASTSGITELDISDNSLNRSGAIALANVLIRQRSLSRLALADLNMGDEALIALLVPLTTSQCPIAELLIGGNELTSACVTAIGRYLRAHTTELRVLDLGGNEIGDEGIMLLSEAVRDAGAECALSKVLIADNELSCLPIVLLAQELVKLPGIRRYDIRGNVISTRVGEALAGAFGSSVVVYDPEEDGVDDTGEELEKALQTLADVADVVERPAALVPSIEQSESALSRLGSWLSKGSASQDGSRPSSRVEGVGTVSAMDDSGVIGVEEGSDEEVGGFTTPTVSKQITGVSVTTTNTGDTIEQMEEEVIRRVGGSSNVIQSAEKLKVSIAELSREIDDGMAGRDGEAGTRRVVYSENSRVGDTDEEMNRYLLVSESERREKLAFGDLFADVCRGLFVALFLIVLVLSIVQSQEENTFSYAPV